MNGEIDIVTRRTLKPDWQVNAEKDKNGGAKLEAGNLVIRIPLKRNAWLYWRLPKNW